MSAGSGGEPQRPAGEAADGAPAAVLLLCEGRSDFGAMVAGGVQQLDGEATTTGPVHATVEEAITGKNAGEAVGESWGLSTTAVAEEQ